jgi:hypothetical protein
MRTPKSARNLVVGRPDHRDTQVRYRLEPDGGGTRVFFEHFGFDMSQPWGEQAFLRAEFGWAKMLEQLPGVVGRLARRKGG